MSEGSGPGNRRDEPRLDPGGEPFVNQCEKLLAFAGEAMVCALEKHLGLDKKIAA